MKSQERVDRSDELRRLINFLIERNQLVVSINTLSSKLDINHGEIISYLLELIQKDAIKPLIKVVCPNCGSEVGLYDDPSEIPQETTICEMCHAKVNLKREEGWELVFKINLEKLYELKGVDDPFFRNH